MDTEIECWQYRSKTDSLNHKGKKKPFTCSLSVFSSNNPKISQLLTSNQNILFWLCRFSLIWFLLYTLSLSPSLSDPTKTKISSKIGKYINDSYDNYLSGPMNNTCAKNRTSFPIPQVKVHTRESEIWGLFLPTWCYKQPSPLEVRLVIRGFIFNMKFGCWIL